MHLSEILLDSKLARNPYEIHRLLWSFFPGMPDSDRPFLFRVSSERKGKPVSVLMQSLIAPDINLKGCSLLRTKEFHLSFRDGACYRFLLCANPIKRLAKERCRVPFINENQLVDWLTHKLEPAAKIESADIVEKRNLYFRKKGEVGKIATVTFIGVLRVLSGEKLARSLENGIGPAKAFGCGMLSLAKT